MIKAELIENIAKDADISKAAAGVALNSFVDNVTKSFLSSLLIPLSEPVSLPCHPE